jgi:hypothetical protein
MRRSCLLFFCLLAAGCASKSNWSHSQIDSGSAQFSSSRLTHTLADAPNRLQLEVIQTKNTRKGYLYVHSHPIPPSKANPKLSNVYIQTEDNSFSYLAIRHSGGNRILLPEEALEKIFYALKSGEIVTLKSGGYVATLSPNGFENEYKKFQSPSKFSKFSWKPL